VLTAYYSPLPDQCCYIKGSEVADKILNGNGTHGADGTPVYPGMIAAPKSYPFGTRIALPGIGTMTVHDRGGAITEWDDAHRIDVWAGHGEEGLARALAFGVKRVKGTVYPPKAEKPAEAVDLAKLPAPLERLTPYIVSENGLLDVTAKFGEKSFSVTILQQALKDAGYFSGATTGTFGDQTRESLRRFVSEMRLQQPEDHLTELTAAYLIASRDLTVQEHVVPFVNPQSGKADIQKAQRALRFLGHYRGRTDGTYDDDLSNAIFAYQQSTQLVGNKEAPGAGRIGPLTRGKLLTEWGRKMVGMQAKKLLLLKQTKALLATRGTLVTRFLGKGDNGAQVRTLQELLAKHGFFPAEKVNGNFGELTRASVLAYQLERGIVKSDKDQGAGTVGAMTMRSLRDEEVQRAFRVVRGFGLAAL